MFPRVFRASVKQMAFKDKLPDRLLKDQGANVQFPQCREPTVLAVSSR